MPFMIWRDSSVQHFNTPTGDYSVKGSPPPCMPVGLNLTEDAIRLLPDGRLASDRQDLQAGPPSLFTALLLLFDASATCPDVFVRSPALRGVTQVRKELWRVVQKLRPRGPHHTGPRSRLGSAGRGRVELPFTTCRRESHISPALAEHCHVDAWACWEGLKQGEGSRAAGKVRKEAGSGAGRWCWRAAGATELPAPSCRSWASPSCTPGTRPCRSGGPRTTTIPSVAWMTTGVGTAHTPATPACTKSGSTTCTRCCSLISNAWSATSPSPSLLVVRPAALVSFSPSTSRPYVARRWA